MFKKLFILLSVINFVFAQMSCNIAFEVIEEGQNSHIKEAKIFTIKSESEFKKLWQQHKNLLIVTNYPKINFDEYIVIGIFLGTKMSGGYSIEVSRVVEDEYSIVVEGAKLIPNSNSMTTTALTSPFIILKITKTDKEIKFNLPLKERKDETRKF